MKRTWLAALVAAPLIGAAVVIPTLTTPTATAQDQPSPRCVAATDAVATAQAEYDAAIAAGVARARELGVTDENIQRAKDALADGNLTPEEEDELLGLFESSGAHDKASLADLPLLNAVLDTRLALNAAVAAKNIECNVEEDTPPPPNGESMPPPEDSGGEGENEPLESNARSDGTTPVQLIPEGAPETGGGPVG